MKDTDTLWREVVCGQCQSPVLRFYRRDDRLMFDYRTTYTRSDHEALTVAPSHHHDWFNGIDYEDEIADTSSVLLDIECRCQASAVTLDGMHQIARQASKRRAVWQPS